MIGTSVTDAPSYIFFRPIKYKMSRETYCKIMRDGYDAARLIADCERAIACSKWIDRTHSNSRGWSSIPLHTIDGKVNSRANMLRPVLAENTYAPTPILAECPYFQEIMSSLGTVYLARLLRLEPGGVIAPHSDETSICGDIIRCHIPIHTNADVSFFIDGVNCSLPASGPTRALWWTDVARVHWGSNNGTTDRIHLVIDFMKPRNL